jgi:hypothetical protein
VGQAQGEVLADPGGDTLDAQDGRGGGGGQFGGIGLLVQAELRVFVQGAGGHGQGESLVLEQAAATSGGCRGQCLFLRRCGR